MGECVIYNPEAGRGRARQLVHKLKRLRGAQIELRPTAAPGHGSELAIRAIEAGHDTIVAAGGDGTVHEVANGVIAAQVPTTVFGVWPIGSANDYAFALGVNRDWPINPEHRKLMTKGQVDVGSLKANGKSAFFVNGLGLGFNSAVTLESRKIRRLRGMALYGLAFLRALCLHFVSPPLAIGLDGHEQTWRTLALTVNLGMREGGFLVTPHARLDDGCFDYVQAGPLSRWHALTMLPRIANGTLPNDEPLIRQGRCRTVAVRSQNPLRVHLDGELVVNIEDGVTNLRIELLPKAMWVLRASPQPIGK